MTSANSRALKKFCAVRFIKENTVEIVPKNWLLHQSGDEYLCTWPPNENAQEILNLAKRAEMPTALWITHNCTLIHTSKSYARASAVLKYYQSGKEVDIFSTDTELSRPRPTADIPSMPQPSFAVASSNQVFDVNCSNCKDLENKMISMEQEMQSIKKVLFELRVNSQTSLVLQQRLLDQNSPQRFEDFSQLSTVEDLKVFNERLDDNDVFSKMILYFSAFGGKDAHAATRKIMSVLMTNELARQYNWIGSNMKNSFQEFKLIIQLVAASVRHVKSHAETPVTSVESWIARWLRYANDRAKESSGRKRKFCQENIGRTDQNEF